MNKKDLYWLAGLLEGEGSFICGPPSKPRSPIISISMTDEDIINRTSKILGNNYCSTNPRKNHKISYVLAIKGLRAVCWMQTLYSLMGNRRQGQIRKAIKSYEPNKSYKLTKWQVEEIRNKLKLGMTTVALAKEFKVDHTHISNIKNNKTRINK